MFQKEKNVEGEFGNKISLDWIKKKVMEESKGTSAVPKTSNPSYLMATLAANPKKTDFTKTTPAPPQPQPQPQPPTAPTTVPSNHIHNPISSISLSPFPDPFATTTTAATIPSTTNKRPTSVAEFTNLINRASSSTLQHQQQAAPYYPYGNSVVVPPFSSYPYNPYSQPSGTHPWNTQPEPPAAPPKIKNKILYKEEEEEQEDDRRSNSSRSSSSSSTSNSSVPLNKKINRKPEKKKKKKKKKQPVSKEEEDEVEEESATKRKHYDDFVKEWEEKEIDIELINELQDGGKFSKGFSLDTAKRKRKEIELYRLRNLKQVKRAVNRMERNMASIFNFVTILTIAFGVDEVEMKRFRDEMLQAIKDGEFRDELKLWHQQSAGQGPMSRRFVGPLVYTPFWAFLSALLTAVLPTLLAKAMQTNNNNKNNNNNTNNYNSGGGGGGDHLYSRYAFGGNGGNHGGHNTQFWNSTYHNNNNNNMSFPAHMSQPFGSHADNNASRWSSASTATNPAPASTTASRVPAQSSTCPVHDNPSHSPQEFHSSAPWMNNNNIHPKDEVKRSISGSASRVRVTEDLNGFDSIVDKMKPILETAAEMSSSNLVDRMREEQDKKDNVFEKMLLQRGMS